MEGKARRPLHELVMQGKICGHRAAQQADHRYYVWPARLRQRRSGTALMPSAMSGTIASPSQAHRSYKSARDRAKIVLKYATPVCGYFGDTHILQG